MAIVQPRSIRLRLILAHATLWVFIAVVTFPLLMVLSTSFREGNLATGSLIPTNPTLEHWSLAFGIPFERDDGTVIQPPFPVMLWLFNSVKVATLSAALILLLSTTFAYATARMRFRAKGLVLNTMLVVQVFPAVLALTAIYAIFEAIGTFLPWIGINSHPALVLAYAGTITMHVWTIKGYFESIDPSMEEAAIVDGATSWQAFRYILLPMSVPILVVVFILAFIAAINEYPVASILLQTEEQLTLAVGTRFYLFDQNYLWGDFAAAAILSGMPIALLFLLVQHRLSSGLTAGGVKG